MALPTRPKGEFLETLDSEKRLRLAAHLEDNPSLKSKIDLAMSRAYSLALIEAKRETGLAEATFPRFVPLPSSR